MFLSENVPTPPLKGAVLTIAQIIKSVMASDVEAELADLYITVKNMVSLRNTLVEMGWPQPKSLIQKYKSTAAGFTNNTIINKAIKSLCMKP